MYVCVCKGITQQQILDELNKGQNPNSKEVLKRLGVGSDCGICLQEFIDQQLTKIKKENKPN
jgi:bacterioferritin-associated ferredoxin